MLEKIKTHIFVVHCDYPGCEAKVWSHEGATHEEFLAYIEAESGSWKVTKDHARDLCPDHSGIS